MSGGHRSEQGPGPEHLDVLIVGAGLSGIGAACHLRRNCPGKSFAICEAREAMGGTWDLFRYPGIRSDSDMFTLGYSFRPWEEAEAIADGPAILRYLRSTAREYDVEETIRYRHRVTAAEWSSDRARWTVTIERTGSDGKMEEVELTCGFLFACGGYYDYENPYSPRFEGSERFEGPIVHPQHWPPDLDYAGRRVVVIGSGSTAVTLVPAMAADAEHVTMLQRSPGYMLALPGRDPIADLARRFLPKRWVFPVIRWKNVIITQLFFQLSRRAPGLVRRLIRRGVIKQLPEGYDVDTHFNPRYDPWDQRVCLAPDGDLFRAISSGKAEMVTDEIESFTERGVRIESGTELEADLIVTATGLTLKPAGGARLTVDGREVNLSETVGYKGMMLSGVPNFAMSLGYTNASWTLKSDLVAHYVCRLLNHMDARGHDTAMPLAPPGDEPTEPFIDLEAGYVLRSIDQLPRQGVRSPWRLHQNYPLDVLMLKRGPIEDQGIRFSRSARAVEPAPAAPVA